MYEYDITAETKISWHDNFHLKWLSIQTSRMQTQFALTLPAVFTSADFNWLMPIKLSYHVNSIILYFGMFVGRSIFKIWYFYKYKE